MTDPPQPATVGGELGDEPSPESTCQASARQWRAVMRVRAPASAVFDYLGDPERHGYLAGTTIIKDPPGEVGLGTHFETHSAWI